MADIVAKLNYYRVSPRKIRLVADLIKGKNVNEALHHLNFSVKKSSGAVVKLLESAISNAKNNFKVKDLENLYIKKISVDQGPVLKRYMPRARGSASPIKKRTSHITIVLTEKHV